MLPLTGLAHYRYEKLVLFCADLQTFYFLQVVFILLDPPFADLCNSRTSSLIGTNRSGAYLL